MFLAPETHKLVIKEVGKSVFFPADLLTFFKEKIFKMVPKLFNLNNEMDCHRAKGRDLTRKLVKMTRNRYVKQISGIYLSELGNILFCRSSAN